MQKWVHKLYNDYRTGVHLFIFPITVRATKKLYMLEDEKNDTRLSFTGLAVSLESLLHYSRRYAKDERFLSDTYEEARDKLLADLNRMQAAAQAELDKCNSLLETFNDVKYVKQ